MIREQIYFDESDASADGQGWNVVSDQGAVTIRFATEQDALFWVAQAWFAGRPERGSEQPF